jgi:hypothetical protein
MNLKLVSLVVLGGAFAAACGDSTGTGGGGGNGNGGDPQGGDPSNTVTVTTSVNIGGENEGGAEPGEGICQSELFIDDAVYDGCLSANCCASFDPCAADADCLDCLEDPEGAGCDTNALHMAFQECFDTSCPTAICGSELATPSPNLNACIQENCCDSFNPCEADMASNACLMDPELPGCDVDALFATYTTCRDMSCPGDICGSQIGFVTTYPNESQDANFDTNACGTENCCKDMTACADPDGDGYLEENDPDVDACLLCLQEDPNCVGGAIETAATAFTACMTAECH